MYLLKEYYAQLKHFLLTIHKTQKAKVEIYGIIEINKYGFRIKGLLYCTKKIHVNFKYSWYLIQLPWFIKSIHMTFIISYAIKTIKSSFIFYFLYRS